MPRHSSEQLSSREQDPRNLRQLAQEARLNATTMSDDDAAQGLRTYADELEAKADEIEIRQAP